MNAIKRINNGEGNYTCVSNKLLLYGGSEFKWTILLKLY